MDEQPRQPAGLEPTPPPGSGLPPIPEVIDRRTGEDQGGTGLPFGEGGLFGSRSFAGGRVRVYGCSPGCLLISLAVSIILTVLLNLLLRAIF